MKLNKNIISKEQAKSLAPDYVAFIEAPASNFSAFDKIEQKFTALKKGQNAISYHDGQYVQVKISQVNHNDFRAVDGPIVRVSNGEFSWRVDGDKYAYPI